MFVNGEVTLDGAKRVAVQGGRAEAETLVPALRRLWKEMASLESLPANRGAVLPQEVREAAMEGENASLSRVLVCLDIAYGLVRAMEIRRDAEEVPA